MLRIQSAGRKKEGRMLPDRKRDSAYENCCFLCEGGGGIIIGREISVEIVISNRGRIGVSRETQACRMMMNMVNLKKI